MHVAIFGLGPTELAVIALVLLVPAAVVAGIVLLAICLGKRQAPGGQAELIAALQAENRRLREELQRLQQTQRHS